MPIWVARASFGKEAKVGVAFVDFPIFAADGHIEVLDEHAAGVGDVGDFNGGGESAGGGGVQGRELGGGAAEVARNFRVGVADECGAEVGGEPAASGLEGDFRRSDGEGHFGRG